MDKLHSVYNDDKQQFSLTIIRNQEIQHMNIWIL